MNIKRDSIRLYFIILITNAFLLSLIYLLIPSLRIHLIQEDQFLENLTAIFAFDVFLIGILNIWQKYRRKKKLVYSLTPVIGLAIFLDEISFGASIFDFDFPHVADTRIDSIHDFINVFYKFITNASPNDLNKIVVFSIAILAIASVITLGFYKFIQKDKLKIISTSKLIEIGKENIFIIISLLLFFTATIFDLHIIGFRGMKFLEELLEMNGSFALLFACLEVWKRKDIEYDRESI